MQLTLASTSEFRKSLLSKIGRPFDCQKPLVDETPQADESAEQLVLRLAIAKAQSVAQRGGGGFVIGSDQVASVNGDILGKPGNHDNAVAQLKRCSGNTVTFYTGLCLLNANNGRQETLVEPFEVVFSELTEAQIDAYLRAEQPYNCAGSFKSEGMGILLFDALKGRDPNALIGLPLIGLRELFTRFDIDLLTAPSSA